MKFKKKMGKFQDALSRDKRKNEDVIPTRANYKKNDLRRVVIATGESFKEMNHRLNQCTSLERSKNFDFDGNTILAKEGVAVKVRNIASKLIEKYPEEIRIL